MHQGEATHKNVLYLCYYTNSMRLPICKSACIPGLSDSVQSSCWTGIEQLWSNMGHTKQCEIIRKFSKGAAIRTQNMTRRCIQLVFSLHLSALVRGNLCANVAFEAKSGSKACSHMR